MRHRSALNLLVTGFLINLCVLSTGHTAERFTHANFAFSALELLDTISSPLEEQTIVYCRADIMIDGKANTVSCFNKTNPSLAVALESSITDLPFTAATVEEEAVPVRMSFRVVLEQDSAKLLPNLGTMQADYGLNYFAPQERLDLADWHDAYLKLSWERGRGFLGSGQNSRIAVLVDKQGNAASVRTMKISKRHVRDANIVENALEKSRFIPGTKDGEIVSMAYIVAINYDNTVEAIASQ